MRGEWALCEEDRSAGHGVPDAELDRPASSGQSVSRSVVGSLDNNPEAGDDPEQVQDLVSFTAMHWRVAERCGVHPSALTRHYLARLVVQDALAFEERCARKGLPVAPQPEVEGAILRVRRFFRRCIENGRPPSQL